MIGVTTMDLRQAANTIISQAIQAVLPDEAVKNALAGKDFPGRVILVAAGKAAWQMAKPPATSWEIGLPRASSLPSITM